MDITNVLFSPNGRISPNTFWRGTILLVGWQIVLNLAIGFLPLSLALGLMLSVLLLFYPYLCVYGKRLHDSGRSAWQFLLFFFAWLLLSLYVMPAVFQPLVAEETARLQEDMDIFIQEGNVTAMFELVQMQFRSQFVLSVIQIVILNALLGFFVARLKSEPEPNQYGPPTQNAGAPFA
ncbi:MAG: DUF805 domain-containing protein [Pseudomonadota bacterium]